jgi:hypothetical protein
VFSARSDTTRQQSHASYAYELVELRARVTSLRLDLFLPNVAVQRALKGFQMIGSLVVRCVLFRRKTSKRCGSERLQLLVLQFGDFSHQFGTSVDAFHSVIYSFLFVAKLRFHGSGVPKNRDSMRRLTVRVPEFSFTSFTGGCLQVVQRVEPAK